MAFITSSDIPLPDFSVGFNVSNGGTNVLFGGEDMHRLCGGDRGGGDKGRAELVRTIFSLVALDVANSAQISSMAFLMASISVLGIWTLS